MTKYPDTEKQVLTRARVSKHETASQKYSSAKIDEFWREYGKDLKKRRVTRRYAVK